MSGRDSDDPESSRVDRTPDRADDTPAAPTIDRIAPSEAFSLLASEPRIEILRALAETPGDARRFAELFDAVPIEDSGNFGYHLDELRENFVRRTDDGYRLTHAGVRVVGSILAGTYTADAAVAKTATGSGCQLCDGDLVFEYADETARVYCDRCEQGRTFSFPPGCLTEYDPADLPAVSARWHRSRVTRILDGFCPVCAGSMRGELVRGVEPEAEPPRPSLASYHCDRCGREQSLSVATIATFHPVVEGFLFEHGFDTRAGPHSDVWAGLDDSSERVRARDPLAVEVSFTDDGERVLAVVGPDATVDRVERRGAGEG